MAKVHEPANPLFKWAFIAVVWSCVCLPATAADEKNTVDVSPSQPSACSQPFAQSVRYKITEFPLDTIEYLKAYREIESKGMIYKTRLEQFQTDFYFVGTGLPSLKGEIPLIDPDAKAIFINFHGSGTKASGGKNARHILSEIGNHGFAGVSFDLPFHAEGPRSEEILQKDNFFRWIAHIVSYFKKFGKPVYLMGHSFGPSLIFEYLSRNPGSVDGAVALSPAGFTPELEDWFRKHTPRITKAKWGETIEISPEGSRFTYIMSQKFTYNKGVRPDPTSLRPDIPVIVVSGDEEEFFPAPLGEDGMPTGKTTFNLSVELKNFLKNARVDILKDVGHRVFEPKHPAGVSMIMATLLEVAGYEPEDSKSLQSQFSDRMQVRTNSLIEGSLEAYYKNPLFRSFADYHFGKGRVPQLVRTRDDVSLERLWKFYNDAVGAKDKLISQEIRDTDKNWNEFYEKYKSAIKASSKSLKSMFGSYYTALVEKMEKEKADKENTDKEKADK